MEREKDLSIHLKYKNVTCILITKRSNFLSSACSRYNLNEENIEIYEINKKTLKKIDVNSLKDFAHVEIMEKPPISTNQMNGHRQTELRDTPSNSSVATISAKLQQNIITGLTMRESELLLNHLQSLPPLLKRKFDGESTEPIMKNRKIQANPVDQKEVMTQTDALSEHSNPSTSMSVANVQQLIKRYAKKEKKDPATFAELMEKSYNSRRIDIMKNKPMVQGVRESYPLLFNIAELLEERNMLKWKLQQTSQFPLKEAAGTSDTSSSELISIKVDNASTNADFASLHARLNESERTCQQLRKANEALDRALVNERDQRKMIEEELGYVKENFTEETRASDEYRILLEDANEPEYFAETNFAISRTVSTHAHKFRRWLRGRRNYLRRTIKSKNYSQLVYIFYLFCIHLWLLACVFS